MLLEVCLLNLGFSKVYVVVLPSPLKVSICTALYDFYSPLEYSKLIILSLSMDLAKRITTFSGIWGTVITLNVKYLGIRRQL